MRMELWESSLVTFIMGIAGKFKGRLSYVEQMGLVSRNPILVGKRFSSGEVILRERNCGKNDWGNIPQWHHGEVHGGLSCVEWMELISCNSVLVGEIFSSRECFLQE